MLKKWICVLSPMVIILCVVIRLAWTDSIVGSENDFHTEDVSEISHHWCSWGGAWSGPVGPHTAVVKVGNTSVKGVSNKPWGDHDLLYMVFYNNTPFWIGASDKISFWAKAELVATNAGFTVYAGESGSCSEGKVADKSYRIMLESELTEGFGWKRYMFTRAEMEGVPGSPDWNRVNTLVFGIDGAGVKSGCKLYIDGLVVEGDLKKSRELMKNGGFEDVSEKSKDEPAIKALIDKSWDLGESIVLPDGWNPNVSTPGILRVITGKAVRSGDKCITLDKGGNLVTAGYMVTSGRDYKISLWAKGNGTAGANVYQYDGKGQFISTVGVIPGMEATDEWKEYSGIYKPGPDVEAAAIAIFATGNILIDDVSMMKLETSEQEK